MNAAPAKTEGDLWKQSVRMVVVLVGACVLFVGITSLCAVLTTRAFASPSGDTSVKSTEPLAPNKKPLSI